MSYQKIYEYARSNPEGFWMEASTAIDWDVEPSRALSDEKAPLYEWFADGQLNGCWNAVDRHVAAGYGDRTAIIYDSPITSTVQKIS